MLGCKKNPFDYRTKYIGKWEFYVQKHISYPYGYKDTSYTAIGHIDYGDRKDEIKIYEKNGSKGFRSFTVSKNGNLANLSGLQVGLFETKKKIKYHDGWGSPGSQVSIDVTGEKK